ncbi:MAG TPA: ParA family protein [Nitrososphaeraceae archaeon]|nr:ParA family protein [Nitrososphaeraceae archaeon]
MPKTFVFHSYKGGTGKTTLAANYAALLTRRGFRVFLLDLDVYAPSLQSYFEIEPDRWINDFLTGDTELKDVIVDLTSVVAGSTDANFNDSSVNTSTNGKLWLGFSNPKKEEIYKLEGGKQEKVQFLRRFIVMREQLFSDLKADYVIIDTSPGIRYWSINALAIADILFLTLKSGDLDIAGTKKMVGEIYSSFTKFGAKPYLILNKVAGYCVPHSSVQAMEHSTSGSSNTGGTLSTSAIVVQQEEQEQESSIDSLSRETGINVISAMPCYCDIQFSKKEYLTVIRFPQHLFSNKIESLAQESQLQAK